VWARRQRIWQRLGARTFGVAQERWHLHESQRVAANGLLQGGCYPWGDGWTAACQKADRVEFQPNVAAAADGTIAVNFYDRRLACPEANTAEATAAGLALDSVNPNFPGAPPYGASNYCINTSIQFYKPDLTPVGNNIRISQHTWDPQLNSPFRFCSCDPTSGFIGDYFGNTFSGSLSVSTSVSTFDDGTNHGHYQQQVVAILPIP